MFIVCALLLCVNVMLGGGTRSGLLSDAVLQLISVGGLVAVLFRWDRIRATAGSQVVFLIGAIVLLPLLQLVPLPAQVVALIEPNTTVVDTLRLVGLDPSFRALSAAPYATALSALSLLPPMTLLLSMLTLTGSERRSLCLVLVGLCLISIVLGLLQLASGSNSALRFYAFTNYDDAVGFFANRNHFSALIYCSLVFVLALIPQPDTARAEKKRKPAGSALPDAAMLTVWTGAIFVLVVAVMMARSRAGILLAMTGLAMAPLINKRMSRILPDKTMRRVALLVIGLVVLFVFEFAAYRMVERFSGDPYADGRIPFARNTITAAKAFMPFGSGVGTFPLVYPQFPKASDETIDAFANRAHSDVLEFWLEGGLLSIGIAVAFLALLASKARALWMLDRSTNGGYGCDPTDLALSKASVIVIILLVVHSGVDYPLRTGALSAVFALACAMLVQEPQRKAGARRRSAGSSERRDAARTGLAAG